jgi:hypothetical protein
MRYISLRWLFRVTTAMVAFTISVSLIATAAVSSSDENARIADFRTQRLASLTSATGWLTPVALYWLKNGENSRRAQIRTVTLGLSVCMPRNGAPNLMHCC